MPTLWAPFALVLAVSTAADPRPPRLERRFRELAAGYEACFVLYDARQDRTLRVNEAECRRRLPRTRIVGADRNLPRGQGPDGLHAREISREMLGALPR